MTDTVFWTSNNRNWEIGRFHTDIHRGMRWFITNEKKNFSDYPLVYNDGHVEFGYPLGIPEYVKKEMKKLAMKERAGTL